MILYSIIIILSLVTIITCNLLFTSISTGNVYLFTFVSLIAVVAIDAIIAWIVHSIPEDKIHPFKKFYQTGKRERKFYEKLGIKKWKDIIPESGKYLCNFAKDKVAKPNDNKYVLKFLVETCYAEIMHEISFFLGFALLAMPYRWTIVLPVCAVNAFLQLLPVMVQRYNRVRLENLYKFNLKRRENDVQS